MAKIFSADYRRGTFIDSVNKIVGVPTSLSKLIRTEKGTALARVVNHYGVTYTTGSKSLSKFTIVAWIKQRTTDNGDRYGIAYIGNAQIIRRDSYSTSYGNYFNSALLGSISIPITTSLNKWMQFVVTYDGVNVVSSVNNKQIVGIPSATTTTLDFTRIVVGRGSASTRYSDSDILKFDVYDDVISDKEIELDYKALLDTQITEKPIRGFELVKPTDLSSKVRDKITLMSNPTKLITGRFATTGDVTIDSETQFTKTASGVVAYSNYWNINLGKPTYLYFKFSQNNGNPLVIRTSSLNIKFNGSNTITLSEGVLHKVEITNITAGQNIVIDPATSTGTYNIETFFVTSEEGLVAAYNMKPNGNTLVDISGNGNNGTITGCVVQGKEGSVFDGTTGYVNFANTKLATSDFTVITRVKLNDYPIMAKNIISTNTLDNGRFLGIYNKSIGLYNGSEWISGATELTPKQEYTLAYVCDGSVINLYVDGVLDITGSKGPYNGLSLETIGKWTTDFSRNISGVIKDIRFCNRALSVQEIKDYHNSFISPVILEDWSGSAVSDVI